jgi:hypothetical protein
MYCRQPDQGNKYIRIPLKKALMHPTGIPSPESGSKAASNAGQAGGVTGYGIHDFILPRPDPHPGKFYIR